MVLNQSHVQTLVPSELTDLQDWIRHNYNHGIGGTTFMTPNALQNHLDQPPRLRTILQSIGASTIDTDTVRRHYRTVLAILTLCDATRYLEHFTKHPNLRDDKLPFHNQPDHFPSDELWTKFFQQQWHFHAHFFSGDSHTYLHDDTILPFLTQAKEVTGGTAKVSRVTIHPDLKSFGSQTKSPKYYALKTFLQTEPRAKLLYNAERAAFSHFKREGVQPETHNIIAFYGGFVQNNHYSILLEYAEHGTLEQFFKNYSEMLCGQELIPLWERMTGLLVAVITIHSIPSSDELAKVHNRVIFKGWHQDIKPDNILVTSDPDHPGRYIFKLADFGSSHFRTLTTNQENPTVEPLLDRDSRATRMYGSPDCYRGNAFEHPVAREVVQSTDIWSLGGVYSEFLVWSVLGRPGLQSYRDAREQATKAIPGHQDHGCFHDRQKRLPCVDEAHEHAVQEARGSDTMTRLVADNILPYMLCDKKDRFTAAELHYYLKDALKKAEAGHQSPPLRTNSVSATRSRDTCPAPRLEQRFSMSLPVSADDSFNEIGSSVNPSPMTAADLLTCHSQFHSTYPENGIHNPEGRRVIQQRHRTNHTSITPPERNIATLSRANTVIPLVFASPPIKLTIAAVEEQMKQDKQRTFWRTLAGRGKFLSLLADLDTELVIRNLGNRDHIFLVDDAQSMNKHWPQVKQLVKALAWLVSGDDDDGIELKFLKSTDHHQSKDPTRLVAHLDRVRRAGESDINPRLSEILEAYSLRYGAWRNDSLRSSRRRSWFRPSEPKKLSVYVLTNGIWQRKSDAVDSIKPMVDKLVQWQCCANRVGIQFIGFGDNPESIAKLQRLDSKLGLQRDIVDYEPSTRCLLKMINGAIDKNADGDLDSDSDDIETGWALPKVVN